MHEITQELTKTLLSELLLRERLDQPKDKYRRLRDQVIWAVTHYGLIPTKGIIKILRETVIELDSVKTDWEAQK